MQTRWLCELGGWVCKHLQEREEIRLSPWDTSDTYVMHSAFLWEGWLLRPYDGRRDRADIPQWWLMMCNTYSFYRGWAKKGKYRWLGLFLPYSCVSWKCRPVVGYRQFLMTRKSSDGSRCTWKQWNLTSPKDFYYNYYGNLRLWVSCFRPRLIFARKQQVVINKWMLPTPQPILTCSRSSFWIVTV